MIFIISSNINIDTYLYNSIIYHRKFVILNQNMIIILTQAAKDIFVRKFSRYYILGLILYLISGAKLINILILHRKLFTVNLSLVQ